ncbi:MAG: cytochrome b/b6 domain-containing protein [Sphingomonas sp.]
MKTGMAYTNTTKFLHWLTVGLIVLQFIIAWTMPHISHNTPLGTLISFHFSLGVLILAVAIIRLIWWATHSVPKADDIPEWQHASAIVLHWLLYLLLVALPILGWLNASFRGYPVSLFGLFDMPKLLPTSAGGWHWTGDLHVFLATYVFLALTGLHVLAALYHYFIRRDGVLQRMLPSA